MCEWGNTVLVTLPEGHPTKKGRERDVDSCLAPIVRALNAEGMWTTACCCGHGKRPGNIILVDGRELHILPDRSIGHLVDSLFSYPINDRRTEDRRKVPNEWFTTYGCDRRKSIRRKDVLRD